MERLTTSDQVEVYLSEFIESFLYVEGQPFRGENGFEHWPFLRGIYDDSSKFILLKCSRQCSKSTTVGNAILAYSAMIPGHKALYVAPRQEQVQTFSTDRLNTVIETSPILKKMTSRKSTLNVTEKTFINRSVIRLRSSYVNPDRARSVASRLVSIDEVQDIDQEFIPVILECSATYPTNKKIYFTGTPLSFNNVIQTYWERDSTMNEWMVPCPACGKWNGTKLENLGEAGYICSNCSKVLDVRTGQWIASRTNSPYAGYHMNQLMTPYSIKDWGDIRRKYSTYTRSKFMNEVLGESYDSGVKPLSREQLLSCCQGYSMIRTPPVEIRNGLTVAGIDWGTGDLSYTVLVVMTLLNNAFRIHYCKRYEGIEAEQDNMLLDIKKVLHLNNINIIGADYGFGYYYNYALAQEFGIDKVAPVLYSDSSLKKMSWNKDAKHLVVNKRMVLEEIFQLFKKQEIILPRAEEFMSPFGEDILNEYVEETHSSLKLKYAHPSGTADDSLHAITYAIIAAQFIKPRPDLFNLADVGKDRLVR